MPLTQVKRWQHILLSSWCGPECWSDWPPASSPGVLVLIPSTPEKVDLSSASGAAPGSTAFLFQSNPSGGQKQVDRVRVKEHYCASKSTLDEGQPQIPTVIAQLGKNST